ncbi:hypothetical protein JCM33374_g6158 [Metschnikowia sp. JCM 33374]|nr:hypothetical protein JCM33374_g6158 [Metschnikowia sp. JCM 33374]
MVLTQQRSIRKISLHVMDLTKPRFLLATRTLVLKSDVGISELPQIPAFDHFDSGCSIQYNPCFNHTLKKHTTAYPYVLGQTTLTLRATIHSHVFSINETPRRLTWNSQKIA